MIEPKRKFRRRGGAKKKKKPQKDDNESQPQSQPQPTDDWYHSGLGERPSSSSTPSQSRKPGEFQPAASDTIEFEESKGPLPLSSPPSFNQSDSAPSSAIPTSYAQVTLDPETELYLQKLQQSFEQIQHQHPTDRYAFTNPDHDDDNDTSNPSPVTLLARNSLNELKTRIPEVSRHNVACRLLESLLPHAGARTCVSVLDAVLDTGSRQFASLAAHPCASHLLQKCLDGAHVAGVPSKLGDVLSEWTHDIIVQVSSSSSGTHVFRSAVSLLARVPWTEEPAHARMSDDKLPSKSYFDDAPCKPAEEDKNSVLNIAETLLTDVKALHQMIYEPASCGALQVILTSLAVCDSDGDTLKLFATSLLPTNEKSAQDGQLSRNGSVHTLMEHRVVSRLLDRIILVCGSNHDGPLPSVLSDVFRDDEELLRCVRHPIANHCAQRYISGLKPRGEITRVAKALDEAIQTRLLMPPRSGNGDEIRGTSTLREGVVLAIVRAAEVGGDQKVKAAVARAVARGIDAIDKDAPHLVGHLFMRGKAMWGEWCRRIEAAGADDFVFGVRSHGGPQDDANSEGKVPALRIPWGLPRSSVVGALIARALMRMPEGAGQMARASMLSFSSKQIVALCADSVGSRIVEQWVMDTELKRSEKMASKVATILLAAGSNGVVHGGLACVCRNASAGMVLVKCVERASVPVRKKVMEGLAGIYEKLKNDRFGQVVLRKCRVRQYLSRTEDWDKKESGLESRRRLFADILDDGGEVGDAEEVGRSGETEVKAKKKKEKKQKRIDDDAAKLAENDRIEFETKKKGKKRKRSSSDDDVKVKAVTEVEEQKDPQTRPVKPKPMSKAKKSRLKKKKKMKQESEDAK